MGFVYPDRKIIWPDGSEIPAALHDMLLSRLEPDYKIEHGEFAWSADGSLSMKYRISMGRPFQKRETWEIELSYPAGDENTAVHPDATPEQRDWFTQMVSLHIMEWWEGGPHIAMNPVTACRRRR